MSKRLLMGSAVSSVVAALLVACLSMSAPMARGAAPTTIPAGLEIGCPTHFYLGNNPSDSDAPDWSHNAQGVANDGRHWFFTHQFGLLKYVANWQPTGGADAGRLESVGIPAELADKGINHFGDLDHYAGYLFVPFESPGRPEHELVAAVAVFRASDLEMVDWVSLEPELRRTGWLAIHPVEKALYTSHDGLIAGTPLMRYSVDLSKVENSTRGDFLGAPEQVGVLDFDGGAVAGKFEYMQGGVFTPWGDLYLSAGKTGESAEETRGGLHLLRRTDDGTAFQLIESSVNESVEAGAQVFAYEYDPLGFTEDDGEEPEGLDWWNRDNAPDSPYRGQLHAILLENLTLDANIWLKHYRVVYGCQLTNDSDDDGVADGEEAYTHNTHPLLADTDRDGQSDGHELTCGSDPLDTAALAADLDGDRLPDCVDADDDGDGQTDADEAACGSSPSDPNSLAPDFDGDLQPDCLDTDDDNDGSADSGDLCPGTSLATIRYGSCDSGVVDFLLDGAQAGCSVSQSIERLAAASRTKGQLISQVDKLLTDLQKQGRLLSRQKDSIKACVAQ